MLPRPTILSLLALLRLSAAQDATIEAGPPTVMPFEGNASASTSAVASIVGEAVAVSTVAPPSSGAIPTGVTESSPPPYTAILTGVTQQIVPPPLINATRLSTSLSLSVIVNGNSGGNVSSPLGGISPPIQTGDASVSSVGISVKVTAVALLGLLGAATYI